MGKRKSSRKPGSGKAKAKPLDKTFKCLFCQHNGTVSCKLNLKEKVGKLDCKDCGQSFSADINHLTEAIDVYSEWIDACEDANEGYESPPPERQERQVNHNNNKKRAAEPLPEDDEEEEEMEDLPDMRKRRKEDTVVEEEEEEEEEEEDLPDLRQTGRAVVEDDEDE